MPLFGSASYGQNGSAGAAAESTNPYPKLGGGGGHVSINSGVDTNAGKFNVDIGGSSPDLGIGGAIGSLGSLVGNLAGGALGVVGSVGIPGVGNIGQIPEAIGNGIGAVGSIPLNPLASGNLPTNPVLGGTLGGGGKANIGAIPGAMLDVIGLPIRALERWVAGGRTEAAASGGRNMLADALAYAASQVVPGLAGLTGDTTLRDAVTNKPDTLPADLQAQLDAGADPNQIADELVARGAGFSSNQATNTVAEIVYDPMNLIGAWAGKGIHAAQQAGVVVKAGGEANAATSLVGKSYNAATTAMTRAQQSVVTRMVGPATSGVLHALTPKSFLRITDSVSGLAPEYGTKFGDAMGVGNAQIIRAVAANDIAAHAEQGLIAAEKFSSPEAITRLIDERVSQLQRVSAGSIERSAEETMLRVAAQFEGYTAEQMAKETADKLAAITGMLPEDAAKAIGNVSLRDAQTVHLAYWGYIGDKLVQAKNAAIGVAKNIDVSRLTPIARDTLTTDRAKALLALQGDAFREEALRYSQLAKMRGAAYDEAKARDIVKRLLDAGQLPEAVKAAKTGKNALPSALGAWRKEAAQFGYELGFAPKGGWRVVVDKDGNIIASNPFVHFVSDKSPITVRNPLGQFVDTLFRGVTQARIILDSRARLIQGVKDAGINASEAEAIHRRILHEARDRAVAPRGLALIPDKAASLAVTQNGEQKVIEVGLNRFDEAFRSVLGDQRFAEFFKTHDPATIAMESFMGDLQRVGITQKVTGAVKTLNAPNLPLGRAAAAIAEGIYPLVKFRFSPLFQMQELVESPFLNLLRGVEKQAVDPKVADLYKAMSALPDMKWVSEAGYTLNIAGSEAFKRSVGSGPLAPLLNRLPNVKGIKEDARIAQILTEHPEQFRETMQRINPRLWSVMEDAYQTKDAAIITQRFIEERQALAGGDLQKALDVFGQSKDEALRTLRTYLNPDGTVKAGQQAGARAANLAAEAAVMPTGGPTNADFLMETIWNGFEESFRQSAKQAFKTHYFATERSFIERSINHPYLGLYPASYMWGKVLPEFARFLLLRPFGKDAPLVGLAAWQKLQEAYVASLAGNPDFRQWIQDNKDALYVGQMLLPGLPNDLPVNAPAYARHIGADAAAGRAITTNTVSRELGDTASNAIGFVRGGVTLAKAGADVADNLAGVTGDIFANLQKAAAELDGMTRPQR